MKGGGRGGVSRHGHGACVRPNRHDVAAARHEETCERLRFEPDDIFTRELAFGARDGRLAQLLLPTQAASCSIHYAHAWARIMRADTWAHTYIKFVSLKKYSHADFNKFPFASLAVLRWR
jgi:hypothetical protein